MKLSRQLGGALPCSLSKSAGAATRSGQFLPSAKSVWMRISNGRLLANKLPGKLPVQLLDHAGGPLGCGVR